MGKYTYVANRMCLKDATLRNEIWKDVEGFGGDYKVSNLGRIYSEIVQRIMSTPVNNASGGYCCVALGSRSGTRKSFRLHRLVAQAFIPNIGNKKEVNHNDKDKTNNTTENLEWMSGWENTQHKIGIKPWNTKQGRIAVTNHSVARRKMEGFSERIIPMLNKMIPLNTDYGFTNEARDKHKLPINIAV
jgi:hypothetical protein